MEPSPTSIRSNSRTLDSIGFRDLLLVATLIVSITLFIVNIRDTSSQDVRSLDERIHNQIDAMTVAINSQTNSLDSKINDIVYRLNSKDKDEQNWLHRVSLELWIERARQVTAFKELPPLPK